MRALPILIAALLVLLAILAAVAIGSWLPVAHWLFLLRRDFAWMAAALVVHLGLVSFMAVQFVRDTQSRG